MQAEKPDKWQIGPSEDDTRAVERHGSSVVNFFRQYVCSDPVDIKFKDKAYTKTPSKYFFGRMKERTGSECDIATWEAFQHLDYGEHFQYYMSSQSKICYRLALRAFKCLPTLQAPLLPVANAYARRLLISKNRYESWQWYDLIYEQSRRSLGPQHRDTIISLARWGYTFMFSGDSQQASERILRAWELFEDMTRRNELLGISITDNIVIFTRDIVDFYSWVTQNIVWIRSSLLRSYGGNSAHTAKILGTRLLHFDCSDTGLWKDLVLSELERVWDNDQHLFYSDRIHELIIGVIIVCFRAKQYVTVKVWTRKLHETVSLTDKSSKAANKTSNLGSLLRGGIHYLAVTAKFFLEESRNLRYYEWKARQIYPESTIPIEKTSYRCFVLHETLEKLTLYTKFNNYIENLYWNTVSSLTHRTFGSYSDPLHWDLVPFWLQPNHLFQFPDEDEISWKFATMYETWRRPEMRSTPLEHRNLSDVKVDLHSYVSEFMNRNQHQSTATP